MMRVESSLLGLGRGTMLLRSPKAVRFVPALTMPPLAAMDKAGLDLFRWCMVLTIAPSGGMFSSFLDRRARNGR